MDLNGSSLHITLGSAALASCDIAHICPRHNANVVSVLLSSAMVSFSTACLMDAETAPEPLQLSCNLCRVHSRATKFKEVPSEIKSCGLFKIDDERTYDTLHWASSQPRVRAAAQKR